MGFDTIAKCEQFIKAKKGTVQGQDSIMVYQDDTVISLSQYLQQRTNSNNIDDGNPADVPVFDRLSIITDIDVFAAVYSDNLLHIYQYDKREITDFLERSGTGDQSHKDKHLAFRLQLYEKLCLIFPAHLDSEMYHKRRIPDIISGNIYKSSGIPL